jgi:predicted ATPase/DNA-binding winged helix-turn-helix (wHTH) protein
VLTDQDTINLPTLGHSIMKLGRFDIDLGMRRLQLDGQLVRLGSRAFDILAVIVSAGGRLVTRDELMNAVWPGIIVEEGNIDVHMSALRKVLGANRDLIVTVPGRGYQLARPQIQSAPDQPRSPATVKPSLPARRAALVGRDAAASQLREALDRAPVVTLTGTGGVGKTSLAIEVAHQLASQFDEIVSFVELAPLNTKEAVLRAIMESCGLPVESSSVTVPSLAAALSETPRLLLLDSAEHIVSSVAEIVEPLLSQNDALRVLVTSREPLRIRSEMLFKVDPLDVPKADSNDADILRSPAVDLFIQRANSLQANVCTDKGEVQLIGEICRRLDGIPLAIELAAGRAEALGVEGVRRRLDDRLAILTGGYRTAMPRHRTLRATFDASFALLSETAQCLFQRLSLFNSPFTFDSMRAVVCDTELPEEDVIDGIGELVAKSLVNVILDESEAKYRLFESTRAYAADKLRDKADMRLVASRYAQFVSMNFAAGANRHHAAADAAADSLVIA